MRLATPVGIVVVVGVAVITTPGEPGRTKGVVMADAPITIKGAKVRINAVGVTPTIKHRDIVHAGLAANRSNRLIADADRQSIALYIVAMFATVATLCEPKLSVRRDWVKAGKPHFVVDAGSMCPERAGDPEWNDQAFLASAVKWGADLAGVKSTQVSLVRVDDAEHHFYVVPVTK